jgi:hypothetical protein
MGIVQKPVMNIRDGRYNAPKRGTKELWRPRLQLRIWADVSSGSMNETARAVERRVVLGVNGSAVTGRGVLSEDHGVSNLSSDRSIP